MKVVTECDEFYYGAECNIYCKPQSGRYICTNEGERICSAGRCQMIFVVWCLTVLCEATGLGTVFSLIGYCLAQRDASTSISMPHLADRRAFILS